MSQEHKFEILSRKEDLTLFRTALKPLLLDSGLSEKKIHEVTLAVDEVLANVARHGYRGECGRIELVYKDYPDRIEVLIRDFGKCFDPTQMPEPELPPRKPGGLGIYFIKTVMDQVHYARGENNCNELLLTKRKGS